MINMELLDIAGVNSKEGLERFMNDANLYEAVLTAFVNDTVMEKITNFYDSKNYNGLLEAVHEAKGSSGNAGITKVYEASAAFLTLLRSGEYTNTVLETSYNSFCSIYNEIRMGIKTALGLGD